MSKILVIHDSYFFEDDTSSKFYSIHINDEIVERYLHLGDELSFIGRRKKIENKLDTQKLSEIDLSLCRVVTVPEFKNLASYIRNFKQVKKDLEREILTHDIIAPRVPSILGSEAVKLAIKNNKPLIGEIVSCNWDAFWNYGIIGKIIAPYFYLKQKFVVKKIPFSIYVTSNFLQKRYPNNGYSINCSNVHINDVSSEVLEQRQKKISKLNESSQLILGTIAAIDVPYKGQKYVIRALSKSNRKLKYLVVGYGKPTQLLKEIEKENVTDFVNILGPVKHSEIDKFLDELDVYIQPSEQEGLPRSLIEAMSRGIPSIGSRTGGIPELLDEAFIFNKGNVKELTKIIDDFTLDLMKKESKKNFSVSKKYMLSNLNARRFDFYFKFLKLNKLPINNRLRSELQQTKN